MSVTVDSGAKGGVDGRWNDGALDGIGLSYDDDEAMDEFLFSVIGGGRSRVYTIIIILNEEEEVRVVVGKHRNAWVVGRMSESEILDMVGEIFVKLFIKGGREVAIEGDGEFMPVGLDGSILLSFSLLNSDPNDWIYDWELEEFDKLSLAPIIEALAPIANIYIESQVLYHTPKSSMSVWDGNSGSFIFSTSDLPFFVNSNEWHLDTSIIAGGRTKVLQFVVYVPSADECPLLLRLPSGDISKTNGFISPMWGGVVVWNPPNCSMNTQMPRHKRNIIPSKEMEKILQTFIGQLRLLFGFKSSYFHEFGDHKFSFVPSGSGFTEWELDVLYRHHASSNLISCASTLESLSKLVQSLPRMIVTDEIGKQVKFSLEAAELAKNKASQGLYDASAASSIKARALAEDAFFHPSIMSISYSSIEHYFAIYMPYFAPVALHVLLAALKEIKRYRTEKAKYQLYVASQKTTS